MPNSVLGTFSGKACDTNIFNNNDMHLGRKVFETLLASEEYQRAMENHHYIGFCGHPENPDCQDYEHACIVMTDQRLLDNGEVEADFNLIDTPVGRIVKAFIDAGVNFGISIRGVGEVDGGGEVDPEQFIFRGYDLVTFPAYDDCIPKFRAIAASTDAKKQAQYKKICATIDANLKDITSSRTLKVIQEQLPEGDEEYNKIQSRINELDNVNEAEITASVNQQKFEAVTELYLSAASKVRDLEKVLADTQVAKKDLSSKYKVLKLKQSKLDSLVSDQLVTASKQVKVANSKTETSERRFIAIRASLDKVKKELDDTKAKLADSEASYKREVLANTRLKERLSSLNTKRKGDQEAINASENLNLKYQRKIENSSKLLSQKDEEIANLNSRLDETVTASTKLESKTSVLEQENKKLLAKIKAAEEMIADYQQAYANIYANALGVYLTGLHVTAKTSVDELKQMITAGTSTSGVPSRPSFNRTLIPNEDEEDEDSDSEYIQGEDEDIDGSGYSADLVTL